MNLIRKAAVFKELKPYLKKKQKTKTKTKTKQKTKCN